MDRFPSQSSKVSFFCMFCAQQLSIAAVDKRHCTHCTMELPDGVIDIILKYLSSVQPSALALIGPTANEEADKPKHRVKARAKVEL